MKSEYKRQIIDLLNRHRIMSIATNREDGWPQATIVGYANDGLIIYCFIGRDGQKPTSRATRASRSPSPTTIRSP
jgi:nitroimidazol reductase NimA-like FMN-containing flavoprotein (pyridoxamine 5'-phosphate oxidase superfamily)